jgi:hypothetical protein
MMDISNSTISKSGSWVRELFSNSNGATVSLINSTISLTVSDVSDYESYIYSAFNNSGTLTMNNSAINHILTVRATMTTRTLNNSGSVVFDNNSIVNVDSSGASEDRYNGYAIYNAGSLDFRSGSVTNNRANSFGIYSVAGGTAAIKSGMISVTGTNAYGIYAAAGSVTLGEAEPADSPDYGKATAHVSLTSPSITAIGTNSGIGVKKTEGIFNFYDGILTGSTSAKPEPATKVEYLYEAISKPDGNGNEKCTLEYMRN